MILSEQEKNKIRELHKKHSVIKEQANAPMGMMWGSCDPSTLPSSIDANVTLNGQPLTSNDVGKEVKCTTCNPQINGKIDSIFPTTNPNLGPIDLIEDPCPPPPPMRLGIMFGYCDPATNPSQVAANILLDGQMLSTLPNAGVGTEIKCVTCNPQINGKIDSVFVVGPNAPTINVISSPCPPPPIPPLGIMFGSCDPHTNPSQINADITLNGQQLAMLPNQGVGKEVKCTTCNPQINGKIDSVFLASPSAPTIDLIEDPCPPPVLEWCCVGTVGSQQCVQVPQGICQGGSNYYQGPFATQMDCQNSGCGTPPPPPPPHPDKDLKKLCEEFLTWDKIEQKEFCKGCNLNPEPICECCELVRL